VADSAGDSHLVRVDDRPSAGVGELSRAGVRGLESRARRTAKSIVRRTSSSVITLIGTDASDDFDRRSCLVLAPHPDDETFGCGATIARKRDAGSEVKVVIVTDGRRSPHAESVTSAELVAIRRREALVALSRLGVEASDVTFLDFEDGTLCDRTDDVAAALAAVVSETSLDHVVVTSVADRHPDHRALGVAARMLLDTGEMRGELYEYAIWQRVPAAVVVAQLVRRAVGRGGSLRARVSSARPRLVSTNGQIERKASAVNAYESQLALLPVGFVEDFLQQSEVFVRVPQR